MELRQSIWEPFYAPLPNYDCKWKMHPLQPEKNMVLSPLRNESWIIPLGKPTGMAAKGMGNLDWLVKDENSCSPETSYSDGGQSLSQQFTFKFPIRKKSQWKLIEAAVRKYLETKIHAAQEMDCHQ